MDELPYYSGLLVVLHPPPVSILVTAGYRSAFSSSLHPAPFLLLSLGSCTRVLLPGRPCVKWMGVVPALEQPPLSGDERPYTLGGKATSLQLWEGRPHPWFLVEEGSVISICRVTCLEHSLVATSPRLPSRPSVVEYVVLTVIVGGQELVELGRDGTRGVTSYVSLVSTRQPLQ
ncbi:hypothetical protein E2C01_048019 [Portunus trituberculatus]|uniref:Uncharacterized protein n=1 Tax=Portunus trituberculatus TaxID=210409 RepID=A0A5B7G575_PORTR|nr:hypothetical protein [Portunus trituberculatus]